MVGFLADDKEGDSMIGLDGEEGVDVGSDILEDEHDVVSMIKVDSLVILHCLCNFLLFFVFLQEFLHVCCFLLVNYFHWLYLFLFKILSLEIH